MKCIDTVIKYLNEISLVTSLKNDLMQIPPESKVPKQRVSMMPNRKWARCPSSSCASSRTVRSQKFYKIRSYDLQNLWIQLVSEIPLCHVHKSECDAMSTSCRRSKWPLTMTDLELDSLRRAACSIAWTRCARAASASPPPTRTFARATSRSPWTSPSCVQSPSQSWPYFCIILSRS